MASEIKIEADQISQSVCHGCLSQNRRLKPLSGVKNKVFYSLLLSSGVLSGSEEKMICWECEAILRRVVKFQAQICQAQNKIMEMYFNMDTNIKTLSNLSTIINNDYDQNYKYIEQTNIQTDLLKPNKYVPEPVSDTNPTSELPMKNSEVKIEKLELPETSTSQYSDCNEDFQNEDDFPEDTTYIEIETTNTKNETKNENENNKNDSLKKRKKSQSIDYLKHATVKDLNIKFETTKSYFVEEFLDFEDVEKLTDPDLMHAWYRCKECKLNFKTKNMLLLHETFAHHVKPDSPNTCLLCKKKLPNLEKLRDHWKFVHSGYWKCLLCNSYCRRAGRLKHLNNNHTKLYCCTKCHGEFGCRNDFNQHFKKDHDTYYCHHCGKVWHSRASIIKHLLNHPDSYYCKKCNRQMKNARCLKSHLKAYHPEQLKIKVDKEAAYCVECNKQFASVKVFKKHLSHSVKHNYKPPPRSHPDSYYCKKCNKQMKNAVSLRRHLRSYHPEQMKIKVDEEAAYCVECNKQFASVEVYKSHLTYSVKHNYKPPPRCHADSNFCKICNKQLKNFGCLKRHLKAYHPEQMKIKVDKEAAYCVECNKQFISVDVYMKHVSCSVKHNYKRPPGLPCPECGKMFTRKSYMKNHLHKEHMREKAKWKCTICNKIYTNNWGLKIHVKTVHLNIPKVKDKFCDICGRGFFDKGVLTKHYRTHTGERPFKCSYCSAAFAQKSAMVSHQKSRHKDQLLQ